MLRCAVLILLLGCASCLHRRPVHDLVAADAAYRITLRDELPWIQGPREPAVAYLQLLTKVYGYDLQSGFLDLNDPGLRLRIQYSVKQPSGRYETDEADYDLRKARGNRSRWVRNAEAARKQAGQFLGAGTPARSFQRFFYRVRFIRQTGQPDRGSVLLSARTREELDRRTALIVENPNEPCRGVKDDCVAFPRLATVTPQIEVSVRGVARFVVIGTKLREILPGPSPADLRVARRYEGVWLPITWEQGQPEVLDLPLLAGDRVDWSL